MQFVIFWCNYFVVYEIQPYSCSLCCLTPYSNRECFGLVQKLKKGCKLNHSTFSSAITEVASLWHKFTPRCKIFSVLWSTVVWSELLGRSSMNWIFPPPHRKILKLIKMVFDDIWHLTWLALTFLRRILTATTSCKSTWDTVYLWKESDVRCPARSRR